MRSFAEMNDLMTRGVRNVIEMTNRYMGRNAQFMLDVMRETGINVVACTGYYRGRVFPGTCGDPQRAGTGAGDGR